MEVMKKLSRKKKQHEHAENNSEYQRLINERIVAEEIVLAGEIDADQIVCRNENVSSNENTNDNLLLHSNLFCD